MSTALLCAIAGSDDTGPVTPSPTRVRDDAWVARLQRGDERAFEELFKAYIHPLLRFAASYAIDDAAAHEVVDDVFMAIWDRRGSWNPTEGAAAYLFAAVRHRVLNAVRDTRRRERRIDAFVAQDATRDTAHLFTSHEDPHRPDAPVDLADDIARIDRMLAALPLQRRRVMLLRWRYEMSPDEIAGVLGISRNSVYLALSRSLETLRQLFGPSVRGESAR